jgi:List-Bact-rpt repeat protein
LHARFIAPGLVAGLIALALPAAAPAVPLSLTVTIKGTGHGTVECEAEEGLEECRHSYPKGTELFVFAKPASGSVFAGWSGACAKAGAKPECELTMEGAESLTATFEPVESGHAGGGGGGTTQPAETRVSSQTPPPVVPPLPGTAKAGAEARVSAGRAALALSCAGGPCAGTLELSARLGGRGKAIGHAAFNLAAGASTTLRIALSSAAKRALEAGGTLRAKAAGTGVAPSTVRLKLARNVPRA